MVTKFRKRLLKLIDSTDAVMLRPENDRLNIKVSLLRSHMLRTSISEEVRVELSNTTSRHIMGSTVNAVVQHQIFLRERSIVR